MLANSEICHEIHHSWYCYGVGLLDYELELPGSPAVTGTKSDCEAPTVGFKLGLPHLLGHGLPPVERLPCNQRHCSLELNCCCCCMLVEKQPQNIIITSWNYCDGQPSSAVYYIFLKFLHLQLRRIEKETLNTFEYDLLE